MSGSRQDAFLVGQMVRDYPHHEYWEEGRLMRRRALIVGMGAATALPAVAQARPRTKPNIGILVLGDPDPQPFVKTFREGLHELGYVEGQNVVLDIRSAKGDSNRLSYLAETLVRSNVDILVAYQTPAATAAQKATRSIPIVMAYVGDPVATGLVSSLSRPGGNITGSSTVADELAGKNHELLRELCLPKTVSASIDDELCRGSAERQAGHTAGPADGLANPCPGTDAFGVRCNSRRRPQVSGADGLRRRPRCD
jgi:nitroreductase